MKGLKDFRRSLNKDRTSGGKPGIAPPATFTGVKSAVSIQPPKKVIRATRDYRSRAPQELSFHKGDFFHVTSDNAANPDWFEACNPITNARGLVPAAYFEVLSKSSRSPAGGAPGPSASPPMGSSNAASMAMGRAAGAAVTAKGGGGLYAVVKYDFAAERADELEAKAGESIIVIAQSNFEWFVAKPIGRLGGPGLIPVAFVEIRDLASGRAVENVQELIQSGVVPKVEDWKKMTADYKKNTIPLGRFDFQSQPVSNSPFIGAGGMQEGFTGDAQPTPPPKDDLYPVGGPLAAAGGVDQQGDPDQQLPPGMPPGEPLPTGLVTSATVDSFHFEQGDYWFRIQATHVAGPSSSAPPNAPQAPTGEERDLILYRLYEDFYEFQIALLDHFPAEAGRETDADGHSSERILPLMPGPLDQVDDLITSQRRVDLDTYIVELCALPDYILRSELVRLFFEPRPGDHCTTHPPQQGGVGGANPNAADDGQAEASDALGYEEYGYMTRGLDEVEEVRTPAAPDRVEGNGTDKYAEDQPVGPSVGREDDLSSGLGALNMSNGHDRNSQQSGSDSRSSAGGVSGSSYLQPQLSMSRNASATTIDSRGSASSGHQRQASASSRIAPPPAGGAGGPTPPFIKIKIFHRANDDLVAIRVPPGVTHSSLLEKVRDRLGNNINVLRYRDTSPDAPAGGSGMMRISDDEDLKEWLASGAKLTLYADSQ